MVVCCCEAERVEPGAEPVATAAGDDPGGMMTAVLAKTGKTAWNGLVGCGTTRIDPWGKEDCIIEGLVPVSPAAEVWLVTSLI